VTLSDQDILCFATPYVRLVSFGLGKYGEARLVLVADAMKMSIMISLSVMGELEIETPSLHSEWTWEEADDMTSNNGHWVGNEHDNRFAFYISSITHPEPHILFAHQPLIIACYAKS
jgi:hypothetical protein